MVSLQDVRDAARRIAGHVHRTPVLTCATFDTELGAQLFFKCENLQKVGAFKARGAVNAVLALDDDAAGRGVLTHSSGNHAQALAYAARLRGLRCTVVMPADAPALKIAAVRGYGAEIVFCEQTERAAVAERVQSETGATFISPFDNDRVVAGQGTAALELLEEVADLDIVVAPVGGGGLLAGTAITVDGLRGAATRVFGAEPANVDDAYRSLETGVLQPPPVPPDTVADGLRTGLAQRNLEVLQRLGVAVVTVTEEEILTAARDLVQRMKLMVEPSAAVVLAVARRSRDAWAGCRVGAVLTGGNTDASWL